MRAALSATRPDLPWDGLTDWLTYCSILAYVSIAIAEFLAVITPIGHANWILVGPCRILVAVVGLQWLGIRVSMCSRDFFTKMRRVSYVVVMCLIAPARGSLQ